VSTNRVTAKRELGQHFLVDENILGVIGRLADLGPDDVVLEIGPGLGVLTRYLADRVARVVAVEVDRSLRPELEQRLGAASNVELIFGDALALDLASLEPAPGKLVANLPYNVATPLVLDLLDGVPAIDRMLVMVQREVGERLAAAPGTPAYGIPSVKVSYWATADVVGRVGPSVFLPRPKIESVLVRVTRRSQPATPADPDRLFALVRAGFGQRRKMLRRSLAGLVDAGAFDQAGIAPESRAEQLSVREWGQLAGAPGERPE
jgi:16S rRNA (adenine1518-N6/adenine1519-N6)-dimethyltransferase